MKTEKNMDANASHRYGISIIIFAELEARNLQFACSHKILASMYQIGRAGNFKMILPCGLLNNHLAAAYIKQFPDLNI